ncbi:MAG TPA: hypothetical protein VHO28_11395 [Ignavibacteriales bacterium]|nr:hypothetical protein [Ignavibacteriales bacterium]
MSRVFLFLLLSICFSGCVPLVYLLENKNLPGNSAVCHIVEHDSLTASFKVISLHDLNNKNAAASSFDIITTDKRQIKADSIRASYDSLYIYNDSSYVFDMKDIEGIRIDYKFRTSKFLITTFMFTAFGAFIGLTPEQNYNTVWFAAGGFAAGIPFAIDDADYILTNNYRLIE